MFFYIIFAASDMNILMTSSVTVPESEEETIPFSIEGIPLILSVKAVEQYPHSSFGLLYSSLGRQKNGDALIETDEEGRIKISLDPTLSFSENVDAPQLLAYIKEFMETGELKELEAPTDTIIHNYRDLYELANGLCLTSLHEALEDFIMGLNDSVLLEIELNGSNFEESLQKLIDRKDHTLAVLIIFLSDVTIEEKAALFQALAEMPYLVGLYFRGYDHVAVEGTQLLAEAFNAHTPLIKLNMLDGIGDKEIEAFSQMIEADKYFKELVLSLSNITSLGLKSLTQALQKNMTLKKFYLEIPPMEDETFQTLLEMLTANVNVTKLSLQSAHVIGLAEALKFNTSLNKELSLWSNVKIGAEEAIALAKALKINKSIETVFLWGKLKQSEEMLFKTIQEEEQKNDRLLTIYCQSY